MLRHDILKLRIVKVCIEPILRKQLFMVALLDDISVLHDKNQIRIANRRQPMGDDEACSALHQVIHGFLDLDFGSCVDG